MYKISLIKLKFTMLSYYLSELVLSFFFKELGLNKVESPIIEIWLHSFHVFIDSFNNSHKKYIPGETETQR